MQHRRSILAFAAAAALLSGIGSSQAGTIIEEWQKVTPPPAPALKQVTLNPKSTALLVMDLLNANCSTRQPRCAATVPAVEDFVKRARAAHVTVLYTVFLGRTGADFVDGLKPGKDDKVFAALADKFRDPDLEKTLRADDIKTVITVGSAAHGAVLYTASEAAMRGFSVVVPVDGLSAEPLYAEQAAVWTLSHAPTVSQHVTLTRFQDIKF